MLNLLSNVAHVNIGTGVFRERTFLAGDHSASRIGSVVSRASRLCLVVVVIGTIGVAYAPGAKAVTSCPTDQYLASYYNNLTLSGTPVVTRCEYAVGGAWAGNSPAPGVQAGSFSVSYTGSVDFPATGSYVVHAMTGDVSVRVYGDGNLLINQWAQSWGQYETIPTVTAGLHTVTVDVADSATDGQEEFSVSSETPSTSGSFFAQNSFFNNAVPSTATVDPNSSSWVSMLNNDPKVTGISVNDDAWTVPVYQAPSGTPTASVEVTNANNAHITIPYQSSYTPSPDSDAHLAIIDQATGCEYEFQSFNPSSMSAIAEATYHAFTGSGGHVAGPAHSGGELSYLGGLITPQDVSSGVIAHALRFATSDNSWTFEYPGTRSDGTTASGLPEGVRVRLNPSVNLSSLGLTPFQLMVAQALQTYGAYDADGTSGFVLYAESTVDGSTYSQTVSALPKSLISDLQFLVPAHPTTAIQFDRTTDTTCQQPH